MTDEREPLELTESDVAWLKEHEPERCRGLVDRLVQAGTFVVRENVTN